MTLLGPTAEDVPQICAKLLVLPGGERLEVLVDRRTGIPLFNETVYTVAELRARGLASATIQNSNKALLALRLSLAAERIDLPCRLAFGEPLELHELNQIARQVRKTIRTLRAECQQARQVTKPRRHRGLESARARPRRPKVGEMLASDVYGSRIREVLAYLTWCYDLDLAKAEPGSPRYARLKTASDRLSRFAHLFKRRRSRSQVGQREGLNKAAIELLLQVIDPDSPDNPWRDRFVRVRNRLVILLALKLGLRIGEILGLRITREDIDFRTRKLLIRRRADDPSDPRPDQPNAKTRDRYLSYDENLAGELERYVIKHRSGVSGAGETNFLIIASGSGCPLSRSSAKKLFTTLRAKAPGLPADLVAHLLRHTFNDGLSDIMDAQEIPQGRELKLRNYVNGWSDGSTSARTYTRRHTRRKANEISLALQETYVRTPGDPQC